MKKNNSLLAFIIIGIVGTLWHFLFEWSNGNSFIGAIAPVNESTWEHLKLLFFPLVIYTIFEYLFWKEKPANLIQAAVISVVSGMLSIVVIFYTYTGILGFNLSIADISIFFIGLIIMLIVRSQILKKGLFNSSTAKIISLLAAAFITVLFCMWSFIPPSIGIFTPPVL